MRANDSFLGNYTNVTMSWYCKVVRGIFTNIVQITNAMSAYINKQVKSTINSGVRFTDAEKR